MACKTTVTLEVRLLSNALLISQEGLPDDPLDFPLGEGTLDEPDLVAWHWGQHDLHCEPIRIIQRYTTTCGDKCSTHVKIAVQQVGTTACGKYLSCDGKCLVICTEQPE